ncbi:MAG: hypothetical protein Q9201_007570 [Fulgogasparrea decipioides]
MFGHDMSWASFHVLEVMSSSKYLQKRVGYLGAVQSFRPDTEVLMLATNLLKKDITSSSVPTIALPLVTLPHVNTFSLAMSLLSDLLPRLSHSNPNIRKKTVVTLYRLALVYPETLRPAWPKIKELLMNEEEDSSVTAAVVNVVCELGWRRPRDFLPLAPRLFELLVDGGNNWMAIKIIKLFAALTPLEPRLIKKLLPPLANLIRTTPAMSLLYECINGIVQGGILEGADGVREGEEIAALCVGKLRGMIIVEGDPNLKYVALLTFKKIVLSHPDLVSLHQDVIMSCIDDNDVSIRLQALDLSAGMVNKGNLVDLVNRLLQQLRRMPSANNVANDDGSEALKVEPAADSDGEDPEQVLRPSIDNHDGGSALPPEYRITTIRKILDMCAHDTYANTSDFEWYIDVLVQLVGVVPPASGSAIKPQEFSDHRRPASQATSEEISTYVGRELCNVAVRVSSVRPEAVHAAASLLLLREDQQLNNALGSQRGGALRFAAWVVGEYAKQLTDLDATLTALTNAQVRSLPSTVLCAYLQAIPKLLVAIIARASGTWDAEHQTKMSLLMARLLYFLEPLTINPSLEVQERAVELAELIRLFGGSELNPVAPSAQGRIPTPNCLDLDLPLNPDLANLLHEAAEETDSGPEIIDFQTFYMQRPVPSAREAEPAAERLSASEPITTSYQNTEDSSLDTSLLAKKRLQRQIKNKDDPFYIASGEISSGASTPFHDIIRSTNGEGVDVDSIPIMNLDLGEKPINDSYSEPEQPRRKTRTLKKYRIATDENIDVDDLSEPLDASTNRSEFLLSGKRRAREMTKRSLLEVDSSGLDGLTLEDDASGAEQLGVHRQEPDDAEMAKALQEVERLRLEMQRASERVQVSDGLLPEGTLVKKKKKKKVKKREVKDVVAGPSRAESPSDHEQDVGYRDNVTSQGIEEDAPIVKKKRRKKKLLNDLSGPAVVPGTNGSKGAVVRSRRLSHPLTINGAGKEQERKTRLHEYRIAAKRERRLRKADEKKQCRFNATLLRRMIRNSDRRKVQNAALRQVRRLAAIHDPSGALFNIGPLLRQDADSAASAETANNEDWELTNTALDAKSIRRTDRRTEAETKRR